MKPIRPTCFLLSLAAGLVGQQQSGGPLVAVPVAIVAGSNTEGPAGSLATDAVQIKKAGFNDVAAPKGIPGGPDFSLLFAGAVGIEVDAMSLGRDVIAADCSGRVAMPPGAWNVMLFGVDRTTAGAPGSVIEAEATTADGAGGDVFSYMFPGSVYPTGVGDVERVHDSSEIGLSGASTSLPQIAALDYYATEHELPLLGQGLPEPKVFFSLTAATAGAVPTWFLPGMPSGATILVTRWQTGANQWTVPRPYFTHGDFGLPAGADIDALAYEEGRNLVLFSTVFAPISEQLKIACFGTDGGGATINTYENTDGTPVGDETGAGPGGNITAVCTIDPSSDQLGVTGCTIGTKRPPFPLPWPTTLEGAAYRTCGTGGQDAYYTMMSGWPGDIVGPGTAHLFLNVGGIWFALGGPMRVTTDPIVGNPIEFPPTIALGAKYGIELTALWVAVNAAGTKIAMSHPISLDI